MQQPYVKAFDYLKHLGVPVFVRPDHEVKGNFGISAEEPHSFEWVNYHGAMPDWVFGVHPTVDAVLASHGLFAEWETPGSLNVYET